VDPEVVAICSRSRPDRGPGYPHDVLTELLGKGLRIATSFQPAPQGKPSQMSPSVQQTRSLDSGSCWVRGMRTESMACWHSATFRRDDGQIYRRPAARTQTSGNSQELRDEMMRRGGHSEIFKYCTKELIAEDCFGAIFEASKVLLTHPQHVRLDEDGHKLIQKALKGRAR